MTTHTIRLHRVLRAKPEKVYVVQEGVPGVIPAEACYLGWRESLILLAKLVEADG